MPGLGQRDRGGRKLSPSNAAAASKLSKPSSRGLEFLARFQAADGGWQTAQQNAPGFDYHGTGIPQLNSTTAGTGLALLAFSRAAGYTHTDGSSHRQVVERGAEPLADPYSAPDGDLFQPQDAALSNSSRLAFIATALLRSRCAKRMA